MAATCFVALAFIELTTQTNCSAIALLRWQASRLFSTPLDSLDSIEQLYGLEISSLPRIESKSKSRVRLDVHWLKMPTLCWSTRYRVWKHSHLAHTMPVEPRWRLFSRVEIANHMIDMTTSFLISSGWRGGTYKLLLCGRVIQSFSHAEFCTLVWHSSWLCRWIRCRSSVHCYIVLYSSDGAASCLDCSTCFSSFELTYPCSS